MKIYSFSKCPLWYDVWYFHTLKPGTHAFWLVITTGETTALDLGGGGCEYSYRLVLPDEFLFKSVSIWVDFEKKFLWQKTNIWIYPLPPTNAILSPLVITKGCIPLLHGKGLCPLNFSFRQGKLLLFYVPPRTKYWNDIPGKGPTILVKAKWPKIWALLCPFLLSKCFFLNQKRLTTCLGILMYFNAVILGNNSVHKKICLKYASAM